jgi:hypothetical protein
MTAVLPLGKSAEALRRPPQPSGKRKIAPRRLSLLLAGWLVAHSEKISSHKAVGYPAAS